MESSILLEKMAAIGNIVSAPRKCKLKNFARNNVFIVLSQKAQGGYSLHSIVVTFMYSMYLI